MKRSTAYVTMAVLIAGTMSFFGCEYWCLQDRAQSVERLIERELRPGDPEEKVLAFLAERGWSWILYDEDHRSYVLRPESLERCDGISSIRIDLFLDDERRFVRATVQQSNSLI
jgi:hypothetical protein